jgi:hypothetical protein
VASEGMAVGPTRRTIEEALGSAIQARTVVYRRDRENGVTQWFNA